MCVCVHLLVTVTHEDGKPVSPNAANKRRKCLTLTEDQIEKQISSKLPAPSDRTGSQHALQPGEQKKKQDGGGGSDSETPRQLKRLDNKRTSEQTGLTAGPGSVREAVKITRPREGEGGRVRGVRAEGEEGEFLHITDTQDFGLRRERLRDLKQPLTLDLHLPTTLYIFCSRI